MYPFGMQMPSRKYQSVTLSSAEGYRYGFNGKEKDKDINSLTAYDYGFRIYNPGIGKFFCVDPLTKSYPWYTPYQFAGNKVIAAIDLDGLEDKIVTTQFFSDSKLNNSVVNKAPNPDGSCRGVNPSNDKEVVAHALIIQAQLDNPKYNIPTNGQFRFWEFPEHPEKNSASYYVRVDGKLETFTVSPQILKQWNDELPKLRAKLGIAGAVANLVGSGALLKAELKAATGELNAASSEAKQAISAKETWMPSEGGAMGYTLNDGKISLSGRSVTNGKFDFVVTQDGGKLVIGSKHYSLSNGAESVQAAGTLRIYKGKVMEIDNNSGHYKPDATETGNFGTILKSTGIDVSGAKLNTLNSNGVKIGTTKL